MVAGSSFFGKGAGTLFPTPGEFITSSQVNDAGSASIPFVRETHNMNFAACVAVPSLLSVLWSPTTSALTSACSRIFRRRSPVSCPSRPITIAPLARAAKWASSHSRPLGAIIARRSPLSRPRALNPIDSAMTLSQTSFHVTLIQLVVVGVERV